MQNESLPEFPKQTMLTKVDCAFAAPLRSVLSAAPYVKMPRGGPWVRLWRAAAAPGQSANCEGTLSERLEACQLRSAQLRRVLRQTGQRLEKFESDADGQAEDVLRDERARLSDLHSALGKELDMVAGLLTRLQKERSALLAGWRVTEREIMSACAKGLQDELGGLLRQTKRHQVLIAARLIDCT